MPAFVHPWLLLALPLAVLPWLVPVRHPLQWSDLALLPADPLADRLARALQAAMSLAMVATVLAFAGPYLPESEFLRVGRGAEIVLLLDRSRSMDQNFGPETNQLHQGDVRIDESKARIAKRLIAEFAAGRPNDVFSMLDFTNIAIPTLDFTQKRAAVQAAIRAADVGRGLADTDIGHALQAAGERFSDRPYTGSRIVMLVSDGGGQIEPDLRKYLTQLFKRNRIALYWIYIRSYYSPPLTGPIDTENEDSVPERFLNKFFSGIGIPYHAYEAQNPEALKRAIADVGRLEAHPITITDITPRRDLSPWLFLLAAVLCAVLAWTRFLERHEWT
ncbi:MAG: VWA domain-containing protein [Pseudomonadota bacterium]|nr:VWA domain-containing protein [Pseudomonadota bacterium]